MRTLLAIPLLLACGSTPAPAPVIPPKPTPVVGMPSCADAGVLLRGDVADEKTAGAAKEALIAKVCATDAWDASVLACVTSNVAPRSCLTQLTPKQRSSYDEQVAIFHSGDEGAEVAEDGDEPPPPEDDWIACEDAVKYADVWQPPLSVTGDDRTFATGLRTRELIALCNRDEWNAEVRRCLAGSTEKTAPVCVAQLDTAQQTAVVARLSTADALATKSIKLAAKPAAFTCKKVVAAHYADPRWKNELDLVKGKDRTRLIAESRAKMAKACVAEKWSAAERACILSDGSDDCYVAAGRASRWSFPAAGVLVKTGIPECDAYGDVLVKLSTCDKLPEYSRGTLLESFTTAAVYWMKASKEDRASVASSCKAAGDAIRQSGEALGCAL